MKLAWLRLLFFPGVLGDGRLWHILGAQSYVGCNHELCQRVFCFSPCPRSPQGNSRNGKAVTVALQEECSLPTLLFWLKGHSFCCPGKGGVLHLGLFPSSLLLFIVFVAPRRCCSLSKLGKECSYGCVPCGGRVAAAWDSGAGEAGAQM